MKNIITFFVSGIFILPAQVNAQPGFTTDTIVISAASRQREVFTSMAIVHYKQYAQLEFTVRKVQNIRSYRVEAGDDSLQLALIGSITPPCNTVMPSAFAYPLRGISGQYKFYRVVQVSMGQEWIPSVVVSRPSGSYGSSNIFTETNDDKHMTPASMVTCRKP